MPAEETNIFPSAKCQPIARAAFAGIEADILVGGENSPMTAMNLTVRPNTGAPAHISHSEDKFFLVTEGRLVFLVGDDRVEVNSGESISVGQGVVHSFTPLDESVAKMTLVSTPGRHDLFFQAMGSLSTPHIMEEVQTVCQQFGQTIVGPVIEP